ncbi:hypothetical protein [Paenibacillus alvei]|nr:hypothetical protein [Paenibacillus alvei]
MEIDISEERISKQRSHFREPVLLGTGMDALPNMVREELMVSE